MTRFRPYKQLNKLIQNETLEPTFSWGLRMAMAATIPLIWGTATGQMTMASWITLTAECICWVELKGSFGQRMRVLAGGTVLAIVFAFLGSITGTHLWLSVITMLLVGFLAGLFKNLGDRGSGLAICVYVLFIVSNAYPTKTVEELQGRMLLTAIGGGWNLLIGALASLVIPAQEPYRRTIAMIWKANASLVREVSRGWDGQMLRSSTRDIYLKEKEVRTAIDTSFHFYEIMAHQAQKKDKENYQLAQLRKTTALIATHIQAISEELETIRVKDTPADLRLKLHAALKALEEALDRMAVYVILLTPEEELLLASRMTRFNKHLALLRAYDLPEENPYRHNFKRVVQLLERTLKLLESSVNRLQAMEDDLPVFRSYSLMKTLLVLHPNHWWNNARLLFNLNTFTARYALRSAIAATIAMFLYKWLDIDHGYWLPFTAIIVVQPYFGATIRKAIDRVLGTVAGGIAGGLLIRAQTGLYIKEIILFFCFVFMVYFVRKRYSVAAFFITISVVLLFDVEESINPTLILTRALATIGGAALAIAAGFALLPSWDSKWLPVHLSNAIHCNYQYFIATFFPEKPINWTRHKRNAESRNSNAFDSFNRYMQEPAIGKRPYISFYQLITHNVRVTRELNNIHLEQEGKNEVTSGATGEQQVKINESLYWFHKILEEVKKLNTRITTGEIHVPEGYLSPFCLSLHQMLYLDKLIFELKALHKALVQLNEQGMAA